MKDSLNLKIIRRFSHGFLMTAIQTHEILGCRQIIPIVASTLGTVSSAIIFATIDGIFRNSINGVWQLLNLHKHAALISQKARIPLEINIFSIF